MFCRKASVFVRKRTRTFQIFSTQQPESLFKLMPDAWHIACFGACLTAYSQTVADNTPAAYIYG